MMKWVGFIVMALIFAFGCAGENLYNQVTGRWKAFEITEDGNPLPQVSPDQIQLILYLDKTYQYFSTLNYKEAGKYRLDGHFLITLDTILPNAQEKTVEIAYISLDTMTIRMQEDKKERILKLVRTYQ